MTSANVVYSWKNINQLTNSIQLQKCSVLGWALQTRLLALHLEERKTLCMCRDCYVKHDVCSICSNFSGFSSPFFGFRFSTELPCFFLDQIKAWCWYDIQLLVSLNFFMWNIDKSHLTDFLKSYFVDRVTHCVVNGYCIACCWIDTFYRNWWDLLWRFAI